MTKNYYHYYNYALQFLQEKGITVYNGGHQILKPFGSEFKNVQQPRTEIHTIDIAAFPERDICEITYGELLGFGLKISARKRQFINQDGQRIGTEYFICKKTSTGYYDYGGIPQGHKLEMDKNDYLVRLIGNNVPRYVGEWRQLSDWHYRQKIKKSLTFIENSMDELESKSQTILGRLSGQLTRCKQIVLDVPEIPVMVTKNFDLICIPKQKDPVTIGIFGKRGEGKSYLLHSLLNMMYSRWNCKVINMNDLTGETAVWSKPWMATIGHSDHFSIHVRDQLGIYGTKTVPYPFVYLHPERNPKLLNNEMKHPFSVGKKISLPFVEFIQNFEELMGGHKIWDMGKSGRWLRLVVQMLDGNIIQSDFETFKKEVKEKMMLISADEEVPKGVRAKINSILEDMYGQGFLDISNNIPAKWTFKTPYDEVTDYPWLLLMKHDLIPSLLTFYIRDKSWFPQYIKFVSKTIMDAQTHNPLFADAVVMAFIDEITGIISKGGNSTTTESIEQIFTEGRNKRMGAVYATQNYEEVPEKITANTHYTFVFRQGSAGIDRLRDEWEELKLSGKSNPWLTEIRRLRPLHCVALTDMEFVKYKITGEREVTPGPFVGEVLPPISKHKSPEDKL